MDTNKEEIIEEVIEEKVEVEEKIEEIIEEKKEVKLKAKPRKKVEKVKEIEIEKTRYIEWKPVKKEVSVGKYIDLYTTDWCTYRVNSEQYSKLRLK